MTSSRESSPAARLARLGFRNTQAVAEVFLREPLFDAHLEQFRETADPDAAVIAIERILATGGVDAASWDAQQWRALASVCASSYALTDHLVRHPEHVGYVVSGTFDAAHITENLLRSIRGLPWDEALLALRVAYRREVSAIAAFDVVAGADSIGLLPGVAHSLSDLADAVISAALELAIREVPGSSEISIAVIAMGKCGARELNYVSDVDVMFVAHPADEVATAIAQATMRACSEITSEGAIWEVDAALRPEGKAGALVRTLSSYTDYYDRWAHMWEYQALLKARFMAGDAELGQQFVDAISGYVWQAADKPGFVESVQAMRQRVAELVPAKDAQRELKLGKGGLRDVEFAVQLLQLVHGRSDSMVRSSNTLIALEQLATSGYVGREDAAALAQAYRFLRTLEHRIQLTRMRRTHVVPSNDEDLERLGRSLGFYTDAVAGLTTEWKRHAREVRRIHEKLFYRPLLDAVARLRSEDARLSPQAASARLSALGFVDSEGALRHLEAMTSGVSRRAAIQKTLLPVMLEWFADAPDPDAGLLGFRRVSEALGTTPWYLRLLRDESVTAQRLALILGTSRYATDLLLRAPEAVNILADTATLVPRTRSELMAEVQATVARHESTADAISALRSLRRRELLRVACAQLLNVADVEQIGDALTDVTNAIISGAVQVITRTQNEAPPFLVLAMGRYGGAELSFGSDADVMFCFDSGSSSNAHADGDTKSESDMRAAHSIANELRTLLMAPSVDPELIIDADLRPEGKNGPLVRSLDSFAQYYQRWSSGWESQALLRADIAAGDDTLAQQFIELINPIRYHADGLSASELMEIRRLKARMESERLPRGVEPTSHIKMGPGGLADVEWVVQIIQMQHGHEFEQLRTPRTLKALRAAEELMLITADDAHILRESWTLASGLRNYTMLIKGRASDLVSKDPIELSRIAQAMGYGPRSGQRLLQDYLQATRRARVVVMRLLYGNE